MPLYTRTGDDGTTGLPSGRGQPGRRVSKNDPRTEAIGALDELNAAVGLCLAEASRITHVVIGQMLTDVQRNLLVAGSMLAYLGEGPPPVSLRPEQVGRMEKDIDDICRDLPELKHFILPGGSELACRLHVARGVSRRAERAVMSAVEHVHRQSPPPAGRERVETQAKAVQTYLNRLSDLLFALARRANRDAGENDVPWRPET